MTLKEARLNARLTQAQAAAKLGVSLRSYKSYENEPEKRGTLKYRYLTDTLAEESRIDETHGILSTEEIRKICAEQLSAYPVIYCILFGSYAKGKATPQSDIDLVLAGDIEGLRFYGMVETLKTALRKNVDVLTPDQLRQNPALLDEVLKDGIRIYG